MTEAALKSALVKKMRLAFPHWVIFRHEDRFTPGVPDFSVTADLLTSWWEVKLATPAIRTRGVQELSMLRLARVGICFIIIYEEKKGIKRTGIVHPVGVYRPGGVEGGVWANGFDHAFVVNFISGVHHEYHDRT